MPWKVEYGSSAVKITDSPLTDGFARSEAVREINVLHERIHVVVQLHENWHVHKAREKLPPRYALVSQSHPVSPFGRHGSTVGRVF